MSVKRAIVPLLLFTRLASHHSVVCAQAAARPAVQREVAATVTDSTESVRRFVQGFYDWYSKVAQSGLHHPADWEVLTANRYLDADLAALLRGDSIAVRDRDNGSREFFDADPFLGGQDPCGASRVIGVRRVGGAFRATVLMCVRSPDQTKGPRLDAEVRPVNGSWRISNMFGFEGGDLKFWLCKYAKMDARPERRPSAC